MFKRCRPFCAAFGGHLEAMRLMAAAYGWCPRDVQDFRAHELRFWRSAAINKLKGKY